MHSKVEITVKKTSRGVWVILSAGGTVLKIGNPLTNDNRIELARKFRNAADELLEGLQEGE